VSKCIGVFLAPICLVGGIYKIIAKIIANKCNMLLKKIISKSQNAFVRGKQIGVLG
jgi:hypothetical protein